MWPMESSLIFLEEIGAFRTEMFAHTQMNYLSMWIWMMPLLLFSRWRRFRTKKREDVMLDCVLWQWWELLCVWPELVHPLYGDLVVQGSPRGPISLQTLVPKPDWHSPVQLRAPELRQSLQPQPPRSLDYRHIPLHSVTKPCTYPSFQSYKNDVIEYQLCFNGSQL